MQGTEGNDVIVTEGVESVDGLGGNDAICVTGAKMVIAGDGNDHVSMQDPARGPLVILGNGSDVYEGSAGNDRVWDNWDRYDPTEESGTETADVVHTYGGDDKVLSGDWGQPNDDQIYLGSGDDTVGLGGAAGGTAHVAGGRGTDGFGGRGLVPAAMDYDLDAGTGMVGGEGHVTFESFEDIGMSSPNHPVSVRGTSGPNWISVGSPGGRITGVGGDDRIDVGGCGMVARGGAGTDSLSVAYHATCFRYAVRLYGGAGADILTGSNERDVLIGGAGRDKARGDKGRDTCQAEVTHSCERN